jgi:hypothetical protein
VQSTDPHRSRIPHWRIMVGGAHRTRTREVTLLALKNQTPSPQGIWFSYLKKFPGEIFGKIAETTWGIMRPQPRKEILMNKKLAAVREFISAHRVLITAGLTATAFLVLMRSNAKQIEGFMEEHGLKDEYLAWLTDAD